MELSTMYWLQPITQGAANVLISGIWEGLVLAIGIALFLRLTPKLSASTRFIIWTAAFLVLALLPFVHIPHAASAGEAVVASSPLLILDVRWSLVSSALWLIASLIRASSLALHGFRLRALWKSSIPMDAGEGIGALLAGEGRRGTQLCTSTEIDQPSVIGFFSPRILIPAWLFERLTPAELQQIVLHETGHLRRGDDWINLLQKLSLVVLPLNPVLLWIEKRLCFERELACDDGVVSATKAPRAYATCLTSLAEQSLDRRAASLALGAWGSQTSIAGRVHSLLRRGDVLSQHRARGITAAVVLGLLVGAAGLSRFPQLVSFSVPARPLVTFAEARPEAPNHAVSARNVMFRVPAERVQFDPNATLQKASLHSRSGRRPASRAVLNKVSNAQGFATRRPGTMHDGTQYWIVLTSWTDSTSHATMRPAMINKPLLSPYAAVPTEDGWIIIQL